MKFAKMEGLANDFVVTSDTMTDAGLLGILRERAVSLCDRRRGIGGDGVLCVLPSSSADFGMRIYTADGSEAEMCGNGIRCFAVYLRKIGLWDRPGLSVETAAGIIRTSFEGDRIRVDMGAPILDAKKIPVAKESGEAVREKILVDNKEFIVTAVSMGNPHAVIYTDELTDELVLGYGKKLESHPYFPKKANIEFVKVLSDSEIRMRVYERGCGETMACGTGACASVVSGVVSGLHGTNITVHLRGGDLLVEWSGDRKSPVYLTGPATWVYSGEVTL
jgi:diaminopimelate epimerase